MRSCFRPNDAAIKEEIIKDLKEVIIPCIVAEVIHRLNETEEELDKIISHQVAEK